MGLFSPLTAMTLMSRLTIAEARALKAGDEVICTYRKAGQPPEKARVTVCWNDANAIEFSNGCGFAWTSVVRVAVPANDFELLLAHDSKGGTYRLYHVEI